MAGPKPISKVSYREAGGSDLPFIIEVYKLNFGKIIEDHRGWDDRIEQSYFSRELSSAPFLIVLYEGKDAGFLSYETHDALYLRHIEIHPDFNGRGIGTLVIRALTAEKGDKPIRVSVTDMNYRGMDFYTNLGFRKVGEISLLMEGSRGAKLLRKDIMQLD